MAVNLMMGRSRGKARRNDIPCHLRRREDTFGNLEDHRKRKARSKMDPKPEGEDERPDPTGETRAEFLLKKTDLIDALEAAKVPQLRYRRFTLGLGGVGLFSGILGITMNASFLQVFFWALLILAFGFGFYLMAGQEVNRLKRAVLGVEAEIEAMEALEPEETHGLLQ